MTKLTILIAALLFIAHTCCAFKGQEQEQEQESCRKQLQTVNLRHCEKHIMERMQYCGDDDDDVLRGRMKNYIRKGEREDEEEEEEGHMRKCCGEMRKLTNPTCQCRALQKIMETQSCENMEKKEKQQMEKELLKLPLRCGLGPMMDCDLRCREY